MPKSAPMNWAVVFTHPQNEAKAASNIVRQGFECFVPWVKTRKYFAGHKIEREEPLFPRYIFARFEDQWHALVNTTGVVTVLLNGERPAVVSTAIIDGIRKQCDEEGVFIGFRCGQSVRVERGPMTGQIGIYKGMRGKDRCEVLLQLLGAQVSASIREGDLAAA